MTRCYQDGGQFYAETEAGGLIADYGDLVKHDYDMKGAREARALFLQEHGTEYELNPPTWEGDDSRDDFGMGPEFERYES